MKNLTAFDTPPDAKVSNQSQILRMEDSRLSFAIVTGFNIQVWEKKPNSEGGAKWMLHKTINLNKLLSLGPTVDDRSWIVIHGYDEDGNTIFVKADRQVFMIQLKSLELKIIFEDDIILYHPFTSLYTTGTNYVSPVSHCCEIFHALKLDSKNHCPMIISFLVTYRQFFLFYCY